MCCSKLYPAVITLYNTESKQIKEDLKDLYVLDYSKYHFLLFTVPPALSEHQGHAVRPSISC